jgi:primosomal protein N' (replication factor Y) (superfamily II helicase)
MRAPRARLGLIARVHPLVTARAVDRAFDYAIPAELADRVAAGSIVRVPLGSREVDGVVDSLGEPAGDEELKPLVDVTGRVPLPLLELAGWIAEQTASTMARAIALVIPPRPPRRALRMVERQVAEDRVVALTDAQQRAVDECLAAIEDGSREVLLHGVTGSGKTEVYLRVIEEALGHGRGAIVLVPEIALTPQTASRFEARFGETVAVLHSALTPARRGEEHRRIAAGEARVVVGARSAIFAAMPDLGVIVVDEEHDASYKHESDPRYDARRVAAKRARLEGALVI